MIADGECIIISKILRFRKKLYDLIEDLQHKRQITSEEIMPF
jgi:hypothetical protein